MQLVWFLKSLHFAHTKSLFFGRLLIMARDLNQFEFVEIDGSQGSSYTRPLTVPKR
jgi:hypothetical protein